MQRMWKRHKRPYSFLEGEAMNKKTDQEVKASIASISQGWRSLSIQDRNAITNMLNAETARTNAQTNIREFLENVRKTDYDYDQTRSARIAEVVTRYAR